MDASYSGAHMNEAYVLFRNGHLLSGVLDKAHYGSSSFSLVHCCYELYGGHIAGQLLSSLGRVFTAFIQLRGFTLGVEDIMLKPEMQKPMSKILKKTKKSGYEILAQVRFEIQINLYIPLFFEKYFLFKFVIYEKFKE